MSAVFLSPAKINLFLAITGRRGDGFHDLVSVVTTLDFGDRLTVEPREAGGFELVCDDLTVPQGEANLVIRAAQAFRAASGWNGGARFILEKRIPMGAGLGGGSSNAAAVLVALNALSGQTLNQNRLNTLAADLGSDCPLFLHNGSIVMRGRGERVEPLPANAASRLTGRRVLVFKPAFGINTAWAYGRMIAAAPGAYLPAPEAEARLSQWINGTAPAEKLLFNNMESPAFSKFPALPVLLERLRERFGVAAGMSGSGSACFALLKPETPVDEVSACIREAWGPGIFIVEARLR